MEKNKSRSDLLAAGRKKLQQFQKKKEKKGGSSSSGSNVKSLRKTSESEQNTVDIDAASKGRSAEAVDSELARADLSASSSLGEGIAEVSGSVDSMVADGAPVDSSESSALPLDTVNLGKGRSPEMGDAELAPADLSVSPSPDEGEADASGVVDSLVANVAPIDSSAPLLPSDVVKPDEERSTQMGDAEIVPTDLSVSPPDEREAEASGVVDSLVANVAPVERYQRVGDAAELVPTDLSVPLSPDEGEAEASRVFDSLVANVAHVDSAPRLSSDMVKPDEGRSQQVGDAAKLVSTDLSVSPSPDEGNAEASHVVDSLVGDVAPVDSLALSVLVMAAEADDELGRVDSLYSVLKSGDGESELVRVADSSLDAEVATAREDPEVVAITSFVPAMMVNEDGNLKPLDSPTPHASVETGEGVVAAAELDRENQEIFSETPQSQSIDGDAKLMPTDSSAPPAFEEAGEGGVALAEVDRENQEHFSEMAQIHPIVADLKSETASGTMQEAVHSCSDQCDGNMEGSGMHLQHNVSSEGGSLRLENERHEGFIVSEISRAVGIAEGHHHHGPVSPKVTREAERCDDVIKHGAISGYGLEIRSSSQTFVSKQDDDAQKKIEQQGGVDEMHKNWDFSESVDIAESKIMEEPLKVEKAGVHAEHVISPGEDADSFYGCGPANVLEGPEDEKAQFLLESTEKDSVADLRGMFSGILNEAGFTDGLEGIKEQLYLTNIAKDFFDMQLAEQIVEQTEVNQRDQSLLDEVSKLHNLVKETQHINVSVSEELAECRLQLLAITARKEELEIQCFSARKEIDELSSRSHEIDSKWRHSQEEVTPLLAELASCKALLEALQMENASLTGNLLTSAEDRKKLEEENEYLTKENMKLAADLIEHKDYLVMAHDKQAQLEAYLKEEMMHIEQLIEENIYLSSSSDLHKDIIKDTVDKYQQLYADVAGASFQPEKAIDDSLLRDENFDGAVTSGQVESVPVGHSQGYLVQHSETEFFNDADGLFALRKHLEEAEKIVQKLEKAIYELQTHSAFINRVGGKVTSPGVSKLIQAFESKVLHEETVSDEVPSTEGKSADPFMLAWEQTANLRAVLKQLDLDAEKANGLFKKEQDSTRLATVSLNEVQAEYESHKAQNNILIMKNDSMINKLAEYQMRVDGLLNQFDELQNNVDERACQISNQVGKLQKEVEVNSSIIEYQKNSLLSTISEAVEKLNRHTGFLPPPDLTGSDNSDVSSLIIVSLGAATEVIQGLHGKLEAASLDHERISNSYEELNQKFTDVNRNNEVAIGLLEKIYTNLWKLVKKSHGNILDSLMDVKSQALLDLVSSDSEVLVTQLQEWIDERQQLQSLKNGLELELMKTTKDLEEWSARCLDLSIKVEENEKNAHSEIITKLAEDVENVIQNEFVAVDSEKPLVIRLEVLVGFLLQKYKELSEQFSLSKRCLQEYMTGPISSADDLAVPLHILLREEFGSKVLELNELQGKTRHLQSLNLEQEYEIHSLKESLSKTEETLEVVRSQMLAKGTELEQSEQRLSSVREKLSIAVSKGKGLIVQRDSLKQSLAGKLSELDKCLQDLQSKDAIIHDIEAKLKIFSESGERVGALESELSYIRNSATALRESFLLKDSVLQRIEEILENLELPEHFHSRDTIEKIEWLARSIPRTSLPLNEWDQKSSVGGSYSDGGFVVMDSWKEDLQPSSNSELDDLRRKYDELQNKFYGMAEHNEMLEQSLVDRNDLVQRWEEVLDRIDMPLQLRSMEPVDRLDWLGRALSEAQHERGSLILKIENLELSYDSLLVELEESQKKLEESQKKLSDLSATLEEVEREKELLSESLEKVRSENGKISVQSVQGEVEKAELQNEIAELNKKLIDLQERLVKYDHIENDIMRLMSFVNDVLQDHDLTDVPNSGDMVEYLDGALRKIIDMHTTRSLEKPLSKDMEKELATEEADAGIEQQRLNHALDAKEQELLALKEELDGALGNLVLVQVENDATLEKYHALVVAVEGISKERDNLQEQLIQEEQKSASLREKLNVAVRKGKGLVQQRDSLKQTIEEMNAEMERLKGELNQRGDAIVENEQKAMDLLALTEKIEELKTENVFLISRLAETEQNLQDSGRTMSGLLTALHAIDVGGQTDVIDPVQKMKEIVKVTRDLHAAAVSSEHEATKSKRAAELLVAELNEVQERADSLQEELAKAEAAVARLSKQREIAEAARIEALSNLEQFTAVRSDEKRKQNADLMRLKSGAYQLRKEYFEFANIINNVFSKDMELLNRVGADMISFLKELNGSNGNDHLPHLSGGIFSFVPINEDKSSYVDNSSELKMQDDNVESDLFDVVGFVLQECVKEIDGLQRKCKKYSINCDHQAAQLPKIMETIQSKFFFQKESSEMQAELEQSKERELKTTISHLQKELQEKNIHQNRIYAELVSQIKEAEATARNYSVDLASAKTQLDNLEKQVEVMKNERKLLEMQINEQQDSESLLKELQERVKSLTDGLNAKDQEIESLMQALDEEESQMEASATKIEELEKIVQQKNLALESLEASRAKVMSKLSTTVSRFNELHHLSENLLSEVKNLESQLQGRDAEISFLRQEVTRYTNDVLALQDSNKRQSAETVELLTWLNMFALRFGMHDVHLDDQKGSRIHAYKEILEKHLTSVLSELNDLRATVQSRDVLLQSERCKVEELVHKEELLEVSLREKETQLKMLQEAQHSGQSDNMNAAEVLEVEPVRNKRAVTIGPVAPHARSMRKVNNDQVAIGIDMEPGIGTLDDEDDDKGHGFRSLTMSSIVPRASRPIADRIDGLWVSSGRVLMRQPTLRLGIVFYWIMLHVLLASSFI